MFENEPAKCVSDMMPIEYFSILSFGSSILKKHTHTHKT